MDRDCPNPLWDTCASECSAKRLFSPQHPGRIHLRRRLVSAQLLLDLCHHAHLRGHRPNRLLWNSAALQLGARTLLRRLRVPGRARLEGVSKPSRRSAYRSILLGGAGVRGLTHHTRSLGPTRLLAGRQLPAHPSCPGDRSLRHLLRAYGRQCNVCGGVAGMSVLPQAPLRFRRGYVCGRPSTRIALNATASTHRGDRRLIAAKSRCESKQ